MRNKLKELSNIEQYSQRVDWCKQKKIIKKLRPYYSPSSNFLKKKKAIFQSLTSDLGLHEGDNKKSLGTSSKGTVLFDYGFTKSVVENYY